MSEYIKFDRCVICRSRDNLKKYHGEFEETLLINTLYMALMFPIEMRQSKGMVKAKTIAEYLRNKNLVDIHDNNFDADSIVRYLRNALAHFNVKVESYGGVVSSIRLWAINRPKKAICKAENVCENPRCIPKQYKADENKEICTFCFSLSELREFTYFVMDHTLKLLPDDVCTTCMHKDSIIS